MNRVKMQGVKLFLTVDNALTLTRYDGYDPEVTKDNGPAAGNYGIDFGYQPTLRSFLAGVSVKF